MRREDKGSGRLEMNEDTHAESITELIFYRILCDVPCSGDGTICKAPDIWKKWNDGLGNEVHRLQVQISMRGVASLKVGGKLVYSTFSMNPVEDEVVVGDVLRQSGGSIEILYVFAKFPELKRRPGLKSWKVRDKGKCLTSHRHVNKHRKTTIVPSMFPSGKSWKDNSMFVATQDCKKIEIEMEPKVTNGSDKNMEEKYINNDMPYEGSKAHGYTGKHNNDGNTISELVEVPLDVVQLVLTLTVQPLSPGPSFT
jgi:multisite-specific tRNA:(cytosine-C5)-methyltransferase